MTITKNEKSYAQMAELVDAPDSKSGFRKEVQVRFLFWARFHLHSSKPGIIAGFVVQFRPEANSFNLLTRLLLLSYGFES